MKRLIVVLVVALVGCQGAYREHPGDDDQPVTCGSVTCDQIPAATCSGDTLREYTAACSDGTCSYPAMDTECGAAGCCSDHCCDVAVSNAETTGTLEPTGLTVTPPNGVFDTDMQCSATSALGACTVVARAGMPEACVCRMDALTIGTLDVKGSRALVILAYETVRVQTALDVSADYHAPGAGSMPPVHTTLGSTVGGVGGSFAARGGSATGNSLMSTQTYGDDTLIPLYGGTAGQSGGYMGNDGGGGGAVQITAGVSIEISGSIFAGGGGGKGGVFNWGSSGGGGGGSGGAILLEAPSITMTGTLNANGGGGGGGGGESHYGTDGEDANDELASGGYGDDGGGCALQGHTVGGDGGNGATSSAGAGTGQRSDYISGCLGVAFVGGGGGGGGFGRIRINTTTGCNCGGKISPSASFGMLGVK